MKFISILNSVYFVRVLVCVAFLIENVRVYLENPNPDSIFDCCVDSIQHISINMLTLFYNFF